MSSGVLDTGLETQESDGYQLLELIRHIMPDMVSRNSGTVVMVSSVQVRIAVPFRDPM